MRRRAEKLAQERIRKIRKAVKRFTKIFGRSPARLEGMTSTTNQKLMQTSKKGEIGEFMAISLKFFRAFSRKLVCKGIDMTRQKDKAHGANQKAHPVSVTTAKQVFCKWILKMKRRLKRKRIDWIAIASLVWAMFSTMLPYIF